MIDSKRNVQVFDADVQHGGSYVYTDENRLSSYLSNRRISAAMGAAFDFRGKSVIDLGCGDGTYTLELAAAGASKVVGLEPAPAAIARAQARADSLGLSIFTFRTGNIYDLEADLKGRFDIAILRGVLHHLPEPEQAVALAFTAAPTVMIIEPNGCNPVLKVIERVSAYHIEHEEKSFLPSTIDGWCDKAGAAVTRREWINLVPMFCPDWLARFGHALGPAVEALPLLRAVCCGQYIVVAQRRAAAPR